MFSNTHCMSTTQFIKIHFLLFHPLLCWKDQKSNKFWVFFLIHQGFLLSQATATSTSLFYPGKWEKYQDADETALHWNCEISTHLQIHQFPKLSRTTAHSRIRYAFYIYWHPCNSPVSWSGSQQSWKLHIKTYFQPDWAPEPAHSACNSIGS